MATTLVSSDPPFFVEGFAELNHDIAVLASACADAVRKSVLHYGEEAWSIGTLPQCDTLAGIAEVRAKSLIIAPQTTGPLIDRVSSVLKSSEYLRAVARAARQSVQLAWLLRNHDASLTVSVFPLIHAVGEAASEVATETALALNTTGRGKVGAARQAALRYRKVDTARLAAQTALRAVSLPAPAFRMTQAALWFMIISGESMARVAARAAAENSTG